MFYSSKIYAYVFYVIFTFPHPAQSVILKRISIKFYSILINCFYIRDETFSFILINIISKNVCPTIKWDKIFIIIYKKFILIFTYTSFFIFYNFLLLFFSWTIIILLIINMLVWFLLFFLTFNDIKEIQVFISIKMKSYTWLKLSNTNKPST